MHQIHTMQDKTNKYGDFESWLETQKDLRANPFSVPEDYFVQLEEVTLFQVAHPPVQEHHAGLEVPQGYFESLENRIAERIAKDAEAQLRSQVEQDGYTVPNIYFETLEQRILHQIQPVGQPQEVQEQKAEQRGRIIRFPRWSKYAAAASIIVFAALFFNNRLQVDAEDTGLAGIPEQEIIQYLQVYTDSRDIMLFSEYKEDWEYQELDPDLSTEDIEWFLENTL